LRELERTAADTNFEDPSCAGPDRVGVVGAGRLGHALSDALRGTGAQVDGPARRDQVPVGEVIVLCVPDAEIAAAAATVAGAAPIVGHTSGATPLAALAAAAEAGAELFALHPLQTFSGERSQTGLEAFAGAGCAVSGSSPAAIAVARRLAERLGMTAFEIDDSHRAAYHAAASIASNFLVTLEDAAERIAGGAGLEPEQARALLAPLVRTTVANWTDLGGERALTGPLARGDEQTVATQRDAVAETAPELLALFDALCDRTRALAARRVGELVA